MIDEPRKRSAVLQLSFPPLRTTKTHTVMHNGFSEPGDGDDLDGHI